MASEKLNSQQLRQKVNSQKAKIEALKSTYETKVGLLEAKKSKLETKAQLGASLKIIPSATKKAEAALSELETVNKELEKLKEEHEKELSEAKKVLSELKTKLRESVTADKANFVKKAKLAKEKIIQNLFWYSMAVVVISLILNIIALCLLGSVATVVLAIIALTFSAIAAIYPVSAFIKQRKNNNIKAKTWFSVAATGIVALMSVVALIINPIARSAIIAREEAKAAEELAELAEECRKSFANVENNWKCSQSKYQNEDFYYSIGDLKKECANKGKRWKDNKSVCLSQEEYDQILAQEKAEDEEKKLKSDCSAKSYDWNYDAKRCNTAEEQKAKNAEKEAERKRQEEEHKRQEEADKPSNQATSASTNNTPAPADTPSTDNSNQPSINTIADACWYYGKTHGIALTDYASSEIRQDGNYYQIIMRNRDKSIWKCWYNPTNNDVFVEKTYTYK